MRVRQRKKKIQKKKCIAEAKIHGDTYRNREGVIRVIRKRERERKRNIDREREGKKERKKCQRERERERVIEEEGEQGGGVVTDERIHVEAFDKSFQPQKQLNLN